MEDKARSRKAGGAGLGLALCDDICRRHGARLEIRSTYQKGTTILIHMDVAPLQTAEKTLKKEPAVRPAPRDRQKTTNGRRRSL